MLSHLTRVIVDRRCEGNIVILWHISEKSHFKSDGQEDAINSQLEMLWPYKNVRHNFINSQSNIKVRNQRLRLHPDQRPRNSV